MELILVRMMQAWKMTLNVQIKETHTKKKITFGTHVIWKKTVKQMKLGSRTILVLWTVTMHQMENQTTRKILGLMTKKLVEMKKPEANILF